MKEYNDRSNLAYDMSLFDVDDEYQKRREQRRREREKNEKADLKLNEKKAVGRNGNAFAALVAVSCAALVAFSILYSKVQLSEYTSMISETETQIEQAKRENARLSAELDSLVTLDNVEKIASEELGLQKTQNSQITFISLNTEEMTEVAEENDNVFISIKNWFYGILEYLGF